MAEPGVPALTTATIKETVAPRGPGILQRAARILEWPVVFLAFLVIPAILFENAASTPTTQAVALGLNWLIWIAFCVDFAVRWAAAGRLSYVREAWFDGLLIVVSPPIVPDYVQGMRSLRALRALRLLRMLALTGMGLRLARRLFGRRRFHYVAALAVTMMLFGALAVYSVEYGINPSITGYGDALWWAVVTTTTVGYGDVSPMTTEGRVIAVGLMLVGISVIGVFTATVASFFFEQEHSGPSPEILDVQRRLAAIEEKLDEMMRRG